MFQIKADENALIATNFETYYQRQMVTVAILILHSYVIATGLHATIFLVFSEQELKGTQLSTYPVVPHRTRTENMVQILPSPAKPISSLCTIDGTQLGREITRRSILRQARYEYVMTACPTIFLTDLSFSVSLKSPAISILADGEMASTESVDSNSLAATHIR